MISSTCLVKSHSMF